MKRLFEICLIAFAIVIGVAVTGCTSTQGQITLRPDGRGGVVVKEDSAVSWCPKPVGTVGLAIVGAGAGLAVSDGNVLAGGAGLVGGAAIGNKYFGKKEIVIPNDVLWQYYQQGKVNARPEPESCPNKSLVGPVGAADEFGRVIGKTRSGHLLINDADGCAVAVVTQPVDVQSNAPSLSSSAPVSMTTPPMPQAVPTETRSLILVSEVSELLNYKAVVDGNVISSGDFKPAQEPIVIKTTATKVKLIISPKSGEVCGDSDCFELKAPQQTVIIRYGRPVPGIPGLVMIIK